MILRVLCLDIEGGYGGSSRSLYESLRHMDRDAVSPEVWCVREGPIQSRYEELGIPTRVVGPLPRHNALPRASRNILALAQAQLALWKRRSLLGELEDAARRFDVIHHNQESLFLLANRLRRRTGVRQVMHLRTNAEPSLFARWQARTIARAVDHVICITENERESWPGHDLKGPPVMVIYNIARVPATPVAPHESVPQDARFRVACVSNFAWVRGVDRLVEVAKVLRDRGRDDVLFVLAGDMRLRGSMPGKLGEIAQRGGSLADYAEAEGVSSYFLFLGHVANPEAVLSACHITARSSRGNNPWGRETLEALAFARPVIATGSYDVFVEDGVTGCLLPEYDPHSFADAVLRLADDAPYRETLGEAAADRIRTLCHGPDRAADLLSVWRSTL